MKSITVKYQIVYWLRHSKTDFKNSITVEAIDRQQALDKAKESVSGVYGSKMLNKFSFNEPVLI